MCSANGFMSVFDNIAKRSLVGSSTMLHDALNVGTNIFTGGVLDTDPDALMDDGEVSWDFEPDEIIHERRLRIQEYLQNITSVPKHTSSNKKETMWDNPDTIPFLFV